MEPIFVLMLPPAAVQPTSHAAISRVCTKINGGLHGIYLDKSTPHHSAHFGSSLSFSFEPRVHLTCSILELQLNFLGKKNFADRRWHFPLR